MAMLANDIFVGPLDTPLYHFDNTQLELSGAKGSFAVDVIGNELSIDTFSAVARYDGPGLLDANGELLYDANSEQLYAKGDVASPKDFLHDVPYGTEVYWFVGGNFYAKGYLKSVDRVSKNGFKLTAVSGVGLLDVAMDMGDMYVNSTVSAVLNEIIGGIFPYDVDSDVGNTRVDGHLPYDTKRNNLHRLLFATGATLNKGDANKDDIIKYLSTANITTVPPSRVALQGQVDYQLPSNRVDVEEHAYYIDANAPTETLYDNTEGVAADGLTVYFENPVVVSTLATTGSMTITDSGVNYAVVSGTGTLTGKYYVHSTQINTLVNNPDNSPERVRRASGNGLINTLNAHNVARRILSYFQSAKTVKGKILAENEKCGSFVRMTDSFGDVTQGFLSRVDVLVTSVIGSQFQIVDGYEPVNGNNFIHCLIIDAAWIAAHGSTWACQSDYIRIVLIGGASGGQGGGNGENGMGVDDMVSGSSWEGHFAYGYENQVSKLGGAAGTAGTAGKVYVTEKSVTVGENITVSVGAGGSGGSVGGGNGSAGTPTTAQGTSIGSLSSESGLSGSGYYEPFSGNFYAANGEAGHKGGDGGLTGEVLYGNRGENGRPGEAVGSYLGGAGGAGETEYYPGLNPNDGYFARGIANGGGGGGAAYGTNGGAGGNANVDGQNRTAASGAGGNGASAVAPAKPAYGCGGSGGNGGGAGGNAGAAMTEAYPPYYAFSLSIGAAGVGGSGSAGGAGGDGVVIIYW